MSQIRRKVASTRQIAGRTPVAPPQDTTPFRQLSSVTAMATRENLPPQVITRIMREIRDLVRAPPLGISYIASDDDVVTEVHAQIEGPGALSACVTLRSSRCLALKAVMAVVQLGVQRRRRTTEERSG